jgi:uncharacterized protein (TIGR03086 family)
MAMTDMGPWGDASKLDSDWRASLPRRVKALAEAWRDPHAWTGITRVGGADQPGEVIGIFALGGLVVHGWDLARGTGLQLPAPRFRSGARGQHAGTDHGQPCCYAQLAAVARVRCRHGPPGSQVKRYACADAC